MLDSHWLYQRLLLLLLLLRLLYLLVLWAECLAVHGSQQLLYSCQAAYGSLVLRHCAGIHVRSSSGLCWLLLPLSCNSLPCWLLLSSREAHLLLLLCLLVPMLLLLLAFHTARLLLRRQHILLLLLLW